MEVVAGLREGDVVITEGIIKIREGVQVRLQTPDGSDTPGVAPLGT